MDQEGGHQSQENRQNAPRNGVDHRGQDNCPKVRIPEYLLEIPQSEVKLEKGDSSQIPQGDRFETEPEIPDHREDHEGEDDCECRKQHPEGKPSLLI
jgi:hypothetical protein